MKGVILMEWINNPKPQGDEGKLVSPTDTCLGHACTSNDSQGPCVGRWCVTKICIWNL